MSFFRQLMEKPWETEGDNVVSLDSISKSHVPPAKTALMFLLVSIAKVAFVKNAMPAVIEAWLLCAFALHS